MKKVLKIAIVFIVLVAGCIQQPTGEIIANQTLEEECISDWNCTFWSDCVRTGADIGIQKRTCLDNNNCNKDKPPESRVCGMPRIALKEPFQMALELSDLPDNNWTIIEKNMIYVEDVSQIEKDLGFKKGYNISFSSKGNETFSQFISIYPLVNSAINMTFSFEAAKENYKTGRLYDNNKVISSISELPNPFIGDFSIAYNITVSNKGFKENIYTICFTKWNVAEVIILEGADYEFLKDLTKKAEEKIA